MPSAEIIAIGTELLLGETPDTNTQTIAHFLRSIGVDLYRTSIVGDNQHRVASLIGEALKRCDVIITTGGLGPTVDDPTREAIAQAFHSKLVFQSDLWDIISKRSKKYGRTAGENLKKQAFIPQGARVIENPVGSAPGFIVIKENHSVISLPGVPLEMETMLNSSVEPFLRDFYGLTDIIKVRVLHCAGASEGWIDEKVGDLELFANPTVGLAAHVGLVDIRLTCKASSETEADNAMDHLEQDIRNRLGRVIFGTDQQTLEDVVLGQLNKKGWSLYLIWQGFKPNFYQEIDHLGEHSIFLDQEQIDSQQDLDKMISEKRDGSPMAVVMAISVRTSAEPYEISITLETPLKKFNRQTIYLGHPHNLASYGINIALNHLRNLLDN